MLNKVSLNTIGLNRIGLNRIGKPSRGSSDRPYIDPEVLASLKAVCICYGKSNDDPDRAIVKNLVDPDNPFVISNAAYTEGSGYADKGSPYYGAFVTDGIDDTIISTKTLAEMGITDEVTVVSMVHQISLNSTYNFSLTNYIENLDGSGRVRNEVFAADKTGIYGYSASLVNKTTSIINTILGDKNDYIAGASSTSVILEAAKFSVAGRASNISEVSSIAWYWSFISNKYLTTDQINQVIAYFNLDRTLKSDIYCNIAKQGITNENHAEFGDKLIDFSGNGRDIQLNNIAWKGDSGIGKYETELSNTSIWTQSKETTSSPFSSSYNGLSGWIIFANTELTNSVDMPSFKIQVKGLLEGQELIYRYYDSNGQSNVYSITKDGDYTLPSDFRTAKPQISNTSGFQVVKNEANIITVTQIPSHAGGLCLDGVNDFGQFVGDLGLKDYTFIMDREYLSLKADQVPVISSINPLTDTPFIFEHCVYENRVARPFSFGKDTVFEEQLVSKRFISYQSTYKYNGKDILKGTSVNTGSGFTIGRYGDDRQYTNFVLYSLMLFPYSMSEFLIERQLKKHKLGTLYPDMVEFRPVIKTNTEWEFIEIYQGDNRLYNLSEHDDKTGIYLEENSTITIFVKPYVGQKVSKIVYNGTSYTDLEDNGYGYDYITVPVTKSPQKIGITIEQDENYVLFNPTINSNVILEVGNEQNITELTDKVRNHEIDGFIMYLSKRESKYILPNSWINKDTEVIASIYCLDNTLQDDLHINIDGNSKYCLYADSSNNIAEFIIMDDNIFEEQYITNVLTANTIDIQLDQYIRYEDIVQPYPSLFTLIDYDTEEVYSWGSKLKVGTKFKGKVINLLPNMYEWQGNILYNGEILNWTVNPGIVAKEMAFSWNMPFKYLIDNNEPKVILSPNRLRIPNSSYKILGHIPDISGHGNHGVIHNSAYSGDSGADGIKICNFYISNYLIDGKAIADKLNNTMSFLNDDSVSIIANPGEATVGGGKARVTGMKSNSRITFYASYPYLVITKDGIYDIPYADADATSIDLMSWSNCKGVTIESLGKYEGAYCLDGVDDFIDIPTLSSGGKQVLMKIYNNTINSMLYDQRSAGTSPNSLYNDFAIYCTNSADNNQIAYQSRLVGKTYIDGILNTNITCENLLEVLHNITITCDIVAPNNGVVPYIGTGGVLKDLYSKVALYDFMLFDNISTEDKIKELNEYVGIEAKVELPPYYWDAYGKTNLDADKDTIQQRGIAVGDYDITNYNHAYDKMSGFGGYPFSKFTDIGNKWQYIEQNSGIEFVSLSAYSYTAKRIGNNTWYYSNVETKYITKDILINVRCSKSIEIKWELKYKTNENPNSYSTKALLIGTIGQIVKTVTLRHVTDEELETLGAIKDSIYYLLYFDPRPLPIGEEYTVEMLPLYPNGLVYDGVTDYSENANIPAFTDYTYILKRQILKGIANSAVMYKGNITVNQGGAFICNYCEPSNTNLFTDFSFGGLLRSNDINNPIIYGTKTSVNGNSITPGEKIDTVGINVGKWVNYLPMVFYKLILYPKTIPLLQINFLKNLMEKDEIIDLNNPIFIQE